MIFDMAFLVKTKIYNTYRLFLILTVAFGFFSCTGSDKRIESLPPGDQEFLSTVRYIITKQEKMEFLSLKTAEERDDFIKEFWKKRDTVPDTEENEFKNDYYLRIEEANRLFGQDGWLTDRGMVFIKLGSPVYRRTFRNEMGDRRYGKPYEVWHYGFEQYPIVFIDRLWSGNYQLTHVSYLHVEIIKKMQEEGVTDLKHTRKKSKFKLKLVKPGSGNNNLIVQVVIPYKDIIFDDVEESFQASFKVKILIKDKDGEELPVITKDILISLKSDELENLDDTYIESIPLKLEQGQYSMKVILESKENKVRLSKEIKFKIPLK